MAWATVTDVRSLVSSNVNDIVITNILSSAQDDIEGTIGTLLSVPTNIKNAHKYRAAVILLRYMKTNGELAYTNKIGVTHQINEIDQMIKDYDNECKNILRTYALSTKFSTYPCYQTIDNLAGEDDA